MKFTTRMAPTQANTDHKVYARVADNRIPLTEKGAPPVAHRLALVANHRAAQGCSKPTKRALT